MFHSLSSRSNTFSVMDGRHVEVTLESIREEQLSIDRLINALLESSIAAPDGDLQRNSHVNGSRSPALSTPLVKTRKTANSNKSQGQQPSISTSTSSPLSTNKKHSYESVVNCLNKLNDQNKRLFSFVENIAKNVESIKQENSSETRPIEESTQAPPTQNAAIESVSVRLERIEQNLNSNILVCRGPTVSNLIAEATTGTSTNLLSLKGEICKAICGNDLVNIDIANLRVGLFGREKKSLKIDCSNPSTRIRLLKQAKSRRPAGLFLAEFLTPTKNSVFYNLRQLKKQHPDKFRSVFTRGGNIYYRLSESDRLYQVSSLSDLEKINLQEQVGDNTSFV